MKYLIVFLVFICAMCVQISSLYAQEYSLSSAYHLGHRSSYLGATLSVNLITWNHQKVVLRGMLSYLSGTTKAEDLASRPSDRVEIGLESKNTMITGKALFNVLDIGYVMSRSDDMGSEDIERVGENGFMFGIGLGTRISAPVSVLAKYMTGIDHGVRFVMEVDF